MVSGRWRRLTIVEWERLMGFPDHYTRIVYNGQEAPEHRRRRAVGNSFPVPILRWIGARIRAVEGGT
jgi:DNA (cytosine-5)-methyltransferase 1